MKIRITGPRYNVPLLGETWVGNVGKKNLKKPKTLRKETTRERGARSSLDAY